MTVHPTSPLPPDRSEADTILLIENAAFFTRILKQRLLAETPFRVVAVASRTAAAAALAREGKQIFLALTNLVLPDASDGEVVEMLIGHHIPCIVFTGHVSEELRARILQLPIIDYVSKRHDSCVDYLTTLINHLHRNRRYQALIVDDSPTARSHFGTILSRMMFRVLEADSGDAATRMIKLHGGTIRVVLVDYAMEDVDGVEWVREARHITKADETAIIGISGTGSPALAAAFLKNGASDYVAKNALREEILVRILLNLDRLHYIEELKHAAAHDFLTGLHNRRYFYPEAERLYANAVREGIPLAVAMIDIDHFKKINDTHGHHAGDMVLKQLAIILQRRLRDSDLLARFGGEEFCLLAMGVERQDAAALFEQIRRQVADSVIDTGTNEIRITISIGVCCGPADGLERMVSLADDCLYQAKRDGRNRICCDGG